MRGPFVMPLLLAGCAAVPIATDTARPVPVEARVPVLVDLLAASGVYVDPTRAIAEVRGWVNMNDGAVEVFACAPGGKTHEAVVVLDCVPRALHAGLLALGLRAGAPARPRSDGSYSPPSGDAVCVTIQWHDADGHERRAAATEWLWRPLRGAVADIGTFVFTGSCITDTPEGDVYAADEVKTLVSTYHDVSSVLENSAGDAGDDEAYAANVMAVPAVGTPIVVTFGRAANRDAEDKHD